MNKVEKVELDKDIYDLSPCGFFSASPDGIFKRINSTFAKITGYEREELLHKIRWQDLLSVGGKIYHETHYIPLLKLKGKLEEINFDLVKKDGRKVPVLINSVQIDDEASKPLIIHSSVLDITQRKQYEKELLIAKKKAEELVTKLTTVNEELEQFAYVASHDLQAPLAAIKGYVQILQLKNESGLDEESNHVLQRILNSIEKMSVLIQDLLEFSRLEKENIKLEAVDLNEVWEYVQKTFELNIKENKALLIVPQLPIVKGNKTQLTRLFQNLLSNSLKYRSKSDPKIEISFSRKNNKWQFYFKDNGIGFAQEQAGDVFLFLKRLQTKNKIPGTGIGMAASKKIVDLHGGTIEASSEPGKGSTFIFTLPTVSL